MFDKRATVAREVVNALQELSSRLERLESASELIKTVLMLRDPEALQAAAAYDGLRKQIVAAVAERRSHVAQLTAMAVAVSRGTDIADLRPQVKEWLRQSGVSELWEVPDGQPTRHYFEAVDGAGQDGAGPVTVIEPAYIDLQTSVLVRMGRVGNETQSAPTVDTDILPEDGTQ
jgi:hypothetical protein